ncbi:PhzF family phenazine biosynthesis protein [Planctomonas sp. JC2975]|uniref:PhzF family phenazine biosynthesis protein n=1 Tax=Planctomonas sp. JC2975 TaxID=2729626 RepID=UPI001475DD52|nr:PhzF family phenazine biosynthesis protein [Planctomonas sp. JC2975]NNC11590.1 PhzF family phenazine biosynthesis protein [Planctomonas sp. JC2975]
MRFAYVDVFAARPLSGNPVVVVDGAAGHPDAVLQSLAREFNQSETAFVLPADVTRDGQADWRLRSFTPTGAEVFGAGHNALGAAVWLAASERLEPGRASFIQAIGGENYTVTVTEVTPEQAHVAIRQAPPTRLATFRDRDALALALGVASDAVLVELVPEVVSTGAAHLLVPLRTRADVDAARPDPGALSRLLSSIGAEGCAVFSLDPAEQGAAAHVRFFNPAMGIAEDPATGTAAGPLAVKLLRDGLVSPARTVVIAQGHRVGRPSLLSVDVDGDHVTLHGDGIVVARGDLLI